MYSLIETAKLNGLVPFNYLMVLFEKAPLASSLDDWEKLLPWNIFTA
ncbi:MAG: transposase domain-containing protein [Treponema sp.]|nr:transposase domain-containing protein [Treponema sp.]